MEDQQEMTALEKDEGRGNVRCDEMFSEILPPR